MSDVFQFLRETVAPAAQALDSSPAQLRNILGRMGKLGLGALRIPAEYGGPHLSETEFRRFQVEAARASGSFAFLQTQHQSAAAMLLRSENEDLKSEVLPAMVTFERGIGIGFSQLRRPGPPLMKATPTQGGYHLSGKVPWITGFGIYQEFLIGATLPDGQALFGIVPLTAQRGISISPVMKLAAMQSAQTVSAEFHEFLLPQPHVAFIRPADWIANNDAINITLQGHFAIGCALAGLDILEANAKAKGLPFLAQTHTQLLGEVEAAHKAVEEAPPGKDEQSTPYRLKLRAWVIDLAVRCAHAAVTSSSGAANSRNHPAQRIYREALVYTVSAQTSQVMEATLDRLASRGSEPIG